MVTNTSLEAYMTFRRTWGAEHKKIIEALAVRGDMSRKEIAIVCGLEISSVCGRVNELMKARILKLRGTKKGDYGVMVEVVGV